MKYLLDTNICVYIIKRKPETVLGQLKIKQKEGVAISAITLAELQHGVESSSYREKNAVALGQILAIMTVLPFDGLAAAEYGKIRASLQRKGTPIGPMDTLIAAHAMARRLVLVTNNTREFERVDGLTLENWI
ncbi:MAG: type II toxin-antitoxin system VapC family toxin [Peptococcaceae bacterium]|jgi:tRNA(fMet)-specific endonuclease VapC|nr:type II toxin-antitoxin system VapC family toxin [Peptococcaceae bacterium]